VELTQQLNQQLGELAYFKPELALAIGSVILLLLVGFRPPIAVIKGIYLLTLVVAIFLLENIPGEYLKSMIIVDELTFRIKLVLLLISCSLVIFPRRSHQRIEYYFMLLAGLIGAFVLMVSAHFLLFYLSIELISFSAYFLTGLRLKDKSAEAVMKYVLFGGVTSSIMIYGISLLYGSSGDMLVSSYEINSISQVGLILFMGGLLFKSSVVPMHLWAPNTYQEAPPESVAYLVVIPKAASFVAIYHIVQSLPSGIRNSMIWVLMIVALITVVWGTVSAIPQYKVKRLLAYGAIAHSGLMLPLALMGEKSLSAFVYYVIAYAMMNVGLFYIIQVHEEDSMKTLKLKDLSGFGKVSPMIAAASVVLLIALVGLPPTAGFSAKLYLFANVLDTYQATGDNIWLVYAIVGILSSLLALYYYFQLPIYYFFKPEISPFERPGIHQKIFATIFAVILLWIFIQPEILNTFVT
jgi:NADH-quinone oxidoreductase subunit N